MSQSQSETTLRPLPQVTLLRKSIARRKWPLGFTSASGFLFFISFTGYLWRFAYRHTADLSGFCKTLPDGRVVSKHGLGPGECINVGYGAAQISFWLHIAGAFGITLLFPFQLLPQKSKLVVWVHRYNGWLLMFLCIVSMTGIPAVSRMAFGGDLEIRLGAPLLAIQFITCLSLAIYYAYQLQFDRHRNWMVRGWAAAFSIFLMRPLFIYGAVFISKQGDFYRAMSCDFISKMILEPQMREQYPACNVFLDAQAPDQWIAVKANLFEKTSIIAITAALQVAFAPASTFAWALCTCGAEIYLSMTPTENNRLRVLSELRQKARQGAEMKANGKHK